MKITDLMASLEYIRQIIESLPSLSLKELETLDSHLQLALKFRRQSEISVDLETADGERETHSYLVEASRQVLQEIDRFGDLTLADQCLLAAVILDEAYDQSSFSNRELHNEVKLNGRPPIAHITTATSGLFEKSYLTGTSNSAQLSAIGKEKATSLIRMFLNRLSHGEKAG